MIKSRNEACWCGSGKKWKACHWPERPRIERNRYSRSDQQIVGIREACRVTADILDQLCKAAVEGTTTEELDQLARELHRHYGARPAPLGYGEPPWQHAICTSLNEVICHGIPGKRALRAGDILNIDVATEFNGYFGDCSRMVCIGEISAEARLVVETSKQALDAAIKICAPGVPIYAIGDAISDVAERQGCSVVHQFVGHGVGLAMHEDPQIPHHRNRSGLKLAPGMTFTIEPMINLGKAEAVLDPQDEWTARTVDGKLSAQWEHTVLITDSGADILTLPM